MTVNETMHDVAYTTFVAAAWPQHLGIAILLTGDPHRAEELLQDCLVKIYVQWRRISAGDPDAYLRRMLVNGNVSRWRRGRRETLTAEVPDRHALDPPEPDDEVRRALLALPRRQRAIVILRHYEDMTEKAVATTLGCSVGTVKNQHFRAMKRLRELLGELQEIPR